MPGVSTKMSCAVSVVKIPSWRLRVVCGLGETAAIFCPNSAFTSVDLPTLGRPMMATKADRNSVISRCDLFNTYSLFARLQVRDEQAQNDEHATDEHLPGKLLIEKSDTQDHSAQRKEIGHHAGARRPDLMDQVIGQDEGQPRSQN